MWERNNNKELLLFVCFLKTINKTKLLMIQLYKLRNWTETLSFLSFNDNDKLLFIYYVYCNTTENSISLLDIIFRTIWYAM